MAELTFGLVSGGITLVKAMREMAEKSVTFLRVARDGQVSQKPSQSDVQRLRREVEILEKLFADQLRETVSATHTRTALSELS